MKQSFGASLLLIIVLLITLSYILYPVFNIGLESVSEFDERGKRIGFTLSNFSKILDFEDTRVLMAFWNSIWVSCLSVVFAAFFGVPLAFLLNTVRFPGRVLFVSLAYTPLTLPPVVGMFAFWMLIGDVGLIPTRLGEIFGNGTPLGVVEGIQAVLLVHAYSFSVYFYALVSAALQRIDPSLKEAGRTLGASPFTIFWKITLPHIAPAIAGAAALSFMVSMGSFSAPYILANGVPFLSVAIYGATFAEGLYQPEYGLAAAMSVIGAIICILFLFLSQRWKNEIISRGVRLPQLKEVSFSWQLVYLGMALFCLFLLLLPQITIGLIAFSDFGKWDSGWLPPYFTLKNYQAIFSDPASLKPIFNSVKWSLCALIWTIFFALTAGWVLSKNRKRSMALLDAALMLPLALPGTVIAFGLLRAFNKATPQTFGFIAAHTVWILPLAYFIRCLPLAVRPIVAAFKTIDPSQEEAARTLGASSFTAFTKVIWPHLAPATGAAALLVFVTSMGEFVASFMVYIPDNIPIGVHLYQCMQSGIAQVAAYSLILILLMFVVFASQRVLLRYSNTLSF